MNLLNKQRSCERLEMPEGKRIRLGDFEFPRLCHRDEDQESVYSWQSYETAFVADSGDDWTNSDISSNEDPPSEYDVGSESTENSHLFSESSSSDVAEINLEAVLVSLNSGNDSLTSLSTGSESANTEQRVDCVNIVPQAAWKCLKCKAPTAAPMKFCVSCYQKRKWSLPPRPSGRKLAKGSSGSQRSSQSATTSSQSSTWIGVPSASDLSRHPSTTATELCSICQVRKPNGGFLHNNIVHSIYCYLCTKMAFNRKSKCPLCRRTIQKAVRIFGN